MFRSNKDELEQQLVTDPNSCRMWLSRSVVPEINRLPGTTFVVNNYTTAGEVAMIFRDDEGLPPPGMKIAVYPRSGHRQLIDIRDPNTDPMLFPLIYAYGQQGIYLNDKLIIKFYIILCLKGFDPNLHRTVIDPVPPPQDEEYIAPESQEEPNDDAEPQPNATKKQTRTTLKDHYSYLLNMRRGYDNMLFYFGKLFQEYVVQAWVKIETNNLHFIRMNQKLLRIQDYSGVMNHLQNELDSFNQFNNNPERWDAPAWTLGSDGSFMGRPGMSRPGRPFILNSGHPGSSRWFRKAYYDATTISQALGKSTYFLTITANGCWAEIQRLLPRGVKYLDRPDICSRVYNQKFEEFLDLVLNKHVLGVVKAYVISREYQKRGMPHNHCLFWMEEQDVPRTAEDIDKYISSEIPDPVTDPELYALVTKYMMHGPCTNNRECMKRGLKNGKCAKGFPKEFCDETELVHGQFPKYKRPDNGRHIVKSNVRLTNQHVIPYNPYLLKYFGSHINMEFTAFFGAMAYILDYVLKGYDKALVEMNGRHFEPPAIVDPARVVDMNHPLLDTLPINDYRDPILIPVNDPNEFPPVDVPTSNVTREDDQIDENEDDYDNLILADDLHEPIPGEIAEPYNEIKTYESN